jgi:uncharacterized protein
VPIARLITFLFLATVAASCSEPAPQPAPEASTAKAPRAPCDSCETEAWRAKHEVDYRRDYVPIAGLHFLRNGSQTAGSAKTSDVVLPASAPATLGTFELTNGVVRFTPDPKAAARVNGEPARGSVVLKDDSGDKADSIEAGGIRLAVHKSGVRQSLRVWEPEGKQAREFLGFTWFDIQPDYRVVGKFIPDAAPRTLDIPNTFGDVDPMKTEGVVEFTLQGRTLRLRPFTTRPKRFWFVFSDASSGIETYKAARFLYSDLKDDGTTVLDFNQAYNPPCAFNPYTTCPLPMAENRLPIKILAGERDYPIHVPLPTP